MVIHVLQVAEVVAERDNKGLAKVRGDALGGEGGGIDGLSVDKVESEMVLLNQTDGTGCHGIGALGDTVARGKVEIVGEKEPDAVAELGAVAHGEMAPLGAAVR
jgi:hypothetical protein